VRNGSSTESKKAQRVGSKKEGPTQRERKEKKEADLITKPSVPGRMIHHMTRPISRAWARNEKRQEPD